MTTSEARSRVRTRRVWCPRIEREVQVEFEERGIPPFRSTVGVRSCTAFEPPSAVACPRRCTDSRYRAQWPPAIPVLYR
jgi:hypothetical protein